MDEFKERPVAGFELVGEDGNIFAILGRFKRAARRDGWTTEEVQEVQNHVTALENYDAAVTYMVQFVDWGDEEYEGDEEDES
jgi:hypothetical protein